MLAAEAGADYVMFGEPDATGERPGFEAIEERVAWWAEVFETPCVGYAASLDEVAPLVAGRRRFRRARRLGLADPQRALRRRAPRRDLARPGDAHDGAAAQHDRRAVRARRRGARRAGAAQPTPPPAPACSQRRGRRDHGEPDMAYGAFQRGHYLTALAEATKRASKRIRPR